MIRYVYQLTNFRTWLRGFAESLGTQVVAGTIRVPPSKGEGYLFATNISPHISYVVMNFSLKDDLIFLRKKTSHYGLSLFFNQVTVNDFVILREPRNSITDKNPKRSNIYLASANYDLEVTYSRHSKIKRVGIFFSPEFVLRHVKKDILNDLLEFGESRFRNIPREPITFEYRQLLEDIFTVDKKSPLSHFLLQNRVLQLTEKFLTGFVSKTPVRRKSNGGALKIHDKQRDIDALKDVEKILMDETLAKFPSIAQLSKTAMMSSTKLKTKFKQIYGMKLYEFFNRNRMEKARAMLHTGEFTVKQVGNHVGFSNLSNFAKAFKKEFGILPKEITKER